MISRIGTVVAVVFLLLFLGVSSDAHAQKMNSAPSEQDEAIILQSWHGDFPVSQLNLLPENQRESSVGYISDAKIFADVWQTFNTGEIVPEIDFKTNLILFARNTQFYNRISIGRVNVKDGAAELLAMETLSAMPIEDKVAISMVLVERRNIKAVRTAEDLVPIAD
ncbi:MAG: hypothetical protein OEM01_14555 [Desulfobulbaceae bacterium]|nr:hypothetical protein [Desulfobulbaceae bacterium]